MKIIVIGGGISGLGAAHILGRKHDVTVIDREDYIGGMASPYQIEWDGNTYSIMKTYHHVLKGDLSTQKIIKDLGLMGNLQWRKIKTAFVYQGKIRGFSTPAEILKFPIPLKDKIRLAKFLLFDLRRKDWGPLERVTAKQWVTESAGNLNYRLFFEKLARNKFQRSPDDISAAWLGGRLSKEAGSARKKFGAISGGFGQITSTLAERCKTLGVKFINGASVTKIKNSGKVKSVSFIRNGGGETLEADAIVSTIPPHIYMKLAEYVSPELRSSFEKIKYLSVICACIGTKLNPRGYYWINVLDEKIPFSVMFEHTSLYKDAAPKGKSVYYFATYLPNTEPLWKKTNEEVINAYTNAADKLIPDFSKNVEWVRIIRFENAETVYFQDYVNPPVKADGVYFAGIFRIYPKTRDIASPFESGVEAAEAIVKDFQTENLA